MRWQAGQVTLQVRERPDDSSTTGSKVWAAAQVLGKFLEHNRRSIGIKEKRVLDLGAGCGLLGLSVAALGARQVVLTETQHEGLFTLLASNVSANRTDLLPSRVSASILDWCEPTTLRNVLPAADTAAAGFDLVVGSDVVYKDTLVAPLVQTMAATCSERGQCFISTEVRDEAVHQMFLDHLAKAFVVRQVRRKKYHPKFDSEHVLIFHCRPHATTASPLASSAANPSAANNDADQDLDVVETHQCSVASTD